MASTWSSLKFELIGTGEQAGTWGTTTNANLGDAIEQAIAGKADITMSSTTVTLTLTDTTALQDARALYLNLSGTPGGAAVLEVPAIEKSYIVKNGSDQIVTVKVTGQTGVAVPVGKTVIVYNNGTDVVTAIDAIPDLTVATLTATSTATFAAGAVGTPSITTAGDTNTGIFFPAADTIAFAEGGAEAMRIDSSGRVGIGTSSPAVQLQVNTGSGAGANIGVVSNGGTLSSSGFLVGQDSTGLSRIYGYGAYPFTFWTNETERMRIDSSGNVGIGTSSPASRLNIAGSDGVGFTITQSGTTTGAADTGGVVVFQNYDGSNLRDGAYIYGRKENATVGNYASYMSFWTRANGVAAAERMRITSAGEVLVGGTTAVAATTGSMTLQNGNASANLYLFRNDASIAATEVIGDIGFYGADTTGNTPTLHAYVRGVASGTHAAGDNPTDLVFGTTPDGSATVAEVLRITSEGFTRPKAYADTVVALGNTGTATTITCTSGNVFTATLTGNCTFTLSAPIATGSSSFTLILTNDGTAGRTVAWSGGTFLFPGGAASLSRTTTANAVDVWVFFTPNGGTTWYGNIAMKNMTT